MANQRRRRYTATKKARKQQGLRQQQRWSKTKKWTVFAISFSVAILGALGSAATLHGYFKSRLSILPENAPISLNNLSMPIRVSNDGILSVHDVRFACRYKKAATDAGSELEDVSITGFPTQTVAEVAPNHPVTLMCVGGDPSGNNTAAITMPGRGQLSYIELEVAVSYRPSFSFRQINDTFNLTGVRAPDGTFHWMPH
jgi:hypothetical protein